jgi:hypothetical protein
MDHEADLFAVLEKVGKQQVQSSESPETPSPDATVGRGPSPVTKRNLFVHHDTHPVVFDVVLLKEYGTDWFVWEAETLWREIMADFKIPSIHDHVKAKIQAIKTLHISEAYWTDWEPFSWVTQAVNNNIPDWLTIQKPSLSQLVNSVDVATMVRANEIFAPEVKDFTAACLLEEGVLYAPNEIKFCQEAIDRYAHDNSIEDYASIVQQVQARYRQVCSNPATVSLEENVVDIQVAKLKVAWDYLTTRRAQLREQLPLL